MISRKEIKRAKLTYEAMHLSMTKLELSLRMTPLPLIQVILAQFLEEAQIIRSHRVLKDQGHWQRLAMEVTKLAQLQVPWQTIKVSLIWWLIVIQLKNHQASILKTQTLWLLSGNLIQRQLQTLSTRPNKKQIRKNLSTVQQYVAETKQSTHMSNLTFKLLMV